MGGAGVVLLGRGRLLAREECSLVHGDQFWDTWLTSEDMEPRRGGHAVFRAGHEGPRSFHNHGAEKAPTRAFSWLKDPTSAFTLSIKTLC